MNNIDFNLANDFKELYADNLALKTEIEMLRYELEIIKRYNVEMIKQIVIDSRKETV